jgi:hypothetical protein
VRICKGIVIERDERPIERDERREKLIWNSDLAGPDIVKRTRALF